MTELVRFFFPKIVLHISLRFGNEHLGEDVAQDFFTKLLTLAISDEIKYPLAWVYRICDNIAKDYFKANGRYNESYRDIDSDALATPETKLLFFEYIEQIKKFEPQTREIILMYLYDRYTLKEISDIMRLNYNTVRQKFSRGIKKLKNF